MSNLQEVLVSEVIPTEFMTKQSQKPTTLEAYHKQKLMGFKEKKDEVTTLRTRLETLKKTREGLTQLSDEWRQLTDEIDHLRK